MIVRRTRLDVVKNKGFLETGDSGFLHKLLGEQFPQAAVGEGHEAGQVFRQERRGVPRFHIRKMRFDDFHRLQVFGAGFHHAILFVIPHAVHVMRPGGQKRIVVGIKIVHRPLQIRPVVLLVMVFVQQFRNQ